MRRHLITGPASAIAGIALLLGISAHEAQAVSVQIDSVTGQWISATGAVVTGLNTYNAPPVGALIEWGGSSPQSGYRFVGNTPPAISGLTENTPFTLGQFSHINNPILPPSITGATLDVYISGNVDGNPFNATSQFQFTHEETTNFFDPSCPYGVGTGINSAGCADKVTAVLNPTNTTNVLVDGVNYVFTFTGFMVGNSTLDYFLTAESAINLADLRGSFITREEAIGEVPLPAALPLFLSGLGGMGLLTWRRRRSAKKAA